jgi:hypothetical protein
MELPTRVKLLRLIELEKLLNAMIDKLLPKRAWERMLKAEPISTVPNIDNGAAKVIALRMLQPDPKRANRRILQEEPKSAKSRIVRPQPN